MQIQAPDVVDGRRVVVRLGGLESRAQAVGVIDGVRRLWSLGALADDPVVVRAQVTGLVREGLRSGRGLPDYDLVRRRVVAGQAASGSMTVGDFLAGWLASRGDLRAGTVASYESVIRVFLVPHLGHVRLDRLRVGHVREMLAAIERQAEQVARANAVRRAVEEARRRAWAAGDREAAGAARAALGRMTPFGTVCGPARRERVRATLRSTLSDAMRQELIMVNPAALVKLASGRGPGPMVWTAERVALWRECGQVPSSVMVWTEEQTAAFLEHVAGDEWGLLYRVLALTGLRRGEAVGLRWQDVSLGGRSMTVCRQLVQGPAGVVAGEPKTRAGVRQVALDGETARLLAERRGQVEVGRAVYGDAPVESGLVFTGSDGSPLWPDKVSARFRVLVARAGLPPVRLHDLRHGAATCARAAGVDVMVVSRMLGHASTAITQDLYTSVLEPAQYAAAEAIADAIGQAGNRRA